jgi:hypothetical protein
MTSSAQSSTLASHLPSSSYSSYVSSAQQASSSPSNSVSSTESSLMSATSISLTSTSGPPVSTSSSLALSSSSSKSSSHSGSTSVSSTGLEISSTVRASTLSYSTLSTSSSSASASATWTSLGCYTDGTPRALGGLSNMVGPMSTEICASFCKGYIYFATEDTQQCFCGDVLNTAGGGGIPASSGCSNHCNGNEAEYCGGVWFMNLYTWGAIAESSSSMVQSSTSSSSSLHGSTASIHGSTSSKTQSSGSSSSSTQQPSSTAVLYGSTSSTVQSSSSSSSSAQQSSSTVPETSTQVLSSSSAQESSSTSAAIPTERAPSQGVSTQASTSSTLLSIAIGSAFTRTLQSSSPASLQVTGTAIASSAPSSALDSVSLTTSSAIAISSPVTSEGDSIYNFKGCYDSGADNTAYHLLTEYWDGGNQIDVETCLQYCEAGAPRHAPPYAGPNITFSYAILEFHGDVDADWCLCTNYFPVYIGGVVDSSKCNTPCVGNNSEFCGGYNPDNSTWSSYGGPNFADVYSLVVPHSTFSRPWTHHSTRSSTIVASRISATASLVSISSDSVAAPSTSAPLTSQNKLETATLSAKFGSSTANAAAITAYSAAPFSSQVATSGSVSDSNAASTSPKLSIQAPDSSTHLASSSSLRRPSAAPSSSSSTASSSTFILQVLPAATSGAARNRWDWHRTDYIGATSAFTRYNCSQAVPYTLSNGQLTDPNGKYFSADPSTRWEPFQPFSTKDSITATIGIFPNGTLYWTNPSFTGGSALFCQTLSGEIYSLFGGQVDLPDRTYPAYLRDCVAVTLSVIDCMLSLPSCVYSILTLCKASECPISTTTITRTVPSHTCPTILSAYHFSTSPTGALCVATTVSWHGDCSPLPTGL